MDRVDLRRSSPYLALLFLAACAFNVFVVGGYGSVNTVSNDGWHYLSAARNMYLGRGFVIDTLWPLNDGLADLPQGDYIAQPFYPWLVSAAFKALGPDMSNAFLVNAVLETAVALVTYLLVFDFTRDRMLSLVAGLAYASNFFVYQMLLQLMTDSAYSLFCALAFLLLLQRRGSLNSALIGFAVGLAFLARFHAIILYPAVILFIARDAGGRRLRNAAVVTVCALAVSSPILARNLSDKGTPFFSPNLYGILEPHPIGAGLGYLAMDGAPTLGEYASRINVGNMLQAGLNIAIGLIYLGSGFGFFLLLAVFGSWRLRDAKGRDMLFIQTVGFYAVVSVVGGAVTFGQPRYVYSLFPFVAAASAFGLGEFIKGYRGLPRTLIYALAIVVVLFDSMAPLQALRAHESDQEEVRACIWLANATRPGDGVMARGPFPAEYLLRARGIQMPAQRDYLRPIIEHYRVRYVIYPRPWWGFRVIGGDEDYLRLVYDEPNRTVGGRTEEGSFRIYEVVGGRSNMVE
ncbi:MAG: glycosyltransferase family 39 protein [Candidatus Altiarchaeota archaeon]